MFSLFLPHALFMTDTYLHYKTNAIIKILQKDTELVEMSIFMTDDSSFSQSSSSNYRQLSEIVIEWLEFDESS